MQARPLISLVMLWAGWKNQQVAKIHVDAPPPPLPSPRWPCVRCGPMPWPVRQGANGSEPRVEVRMGSSLAMWPSWVWAEVAAAVSQGSRLFGARNLGVWGSHKRRHTVSPERAGGRGLKELMEAVSRLGGSSVAEHKWYGQWWRGWVRQWGHTVRCAKSQLFSTTGSYGSRGPEFCTLQPLQAHQGFVFLV